MEKSFYSNFLPLPKDFVKTLDIGKEAQEFLVKVGLPREHSEISNVLLEGRAGFKFYDNPAKVLDYTVENETFVTVGGTRHFPNTDRIAINSEGEVYLMRYFNNEHIKELLNYNLYSLFEFCRVFTTEIEIIGTLEGLMDLPEVKEELYSEIDEKDTLWFNYGLQIVDKIRDICRQFNEIDPKILKLSDSYSYWKAILIYLERDYDYAYPDSAIL